MDVAELLILTKDRGGSDLHLSAGALPLMRLHGQLTPIEDRALSRDEVHKMVYEILNDDQRKVAFQEKQFPEIEQAKTAPNVGEPVGLPGAKMSDEQKGTLLKLLQAYTARMPDDVGEVEFKQVKDAGLDKVYFAYAGGVEEGQPHSYRVQGPSFVVEFLNIQADSAKNPANHIHSAWRRLPIDFGLSE